MNIALFYHSLLSDWNHGNAHFLRGISSELIKRGHKVFIYEPENSWSLNNLVADYGMNAVKEFHHYYPLLNSIRYTPSFDVREALKDADLVIVHEWNDHQLVAKIGQVKEQLGFNLLFHDTHHRAVTEKSNMCRYDLSHYDGVLAYGDVIRKIYLREGWTSRAWTWHEAADTNLFRPAKSTSLEGDLVWIGNWGDNERTGELMEYLVEPVKQLKLRARIYGVRYPPEAIRVLEQAGISYGGWLPNYKVPEIFAKYRVTVHVPRRPYVESLPGIPTIRPFEAMACGIPLVSSPWNDAEALFTTGRDFLMAQNGPEMKNAIHRLLEDGELRTRLSQHSVQTIRKKHTCVHRTDELMAICQELRVKNFTTQRIAS